MDVSKRFAGDIARWMTLEKLNGYCNKLQIAACRRVIHLQCLLGFYMMCTGFSISSLVRVASFDERIGQNCFSLLFNF